MDRISRLLRPHEWRLNPEVALFLFQRWGKPFLDLFASPANTQLPHFCGPVLHPHRVAPDAFLVDWTPKLLYAFPPTPLIVRTLYNVQQDRASVSLVAPSWPQQPWFPLLLQLSSEPLIYLGCAPDILTQGLDWVLHLNPTSLSLMAEWLNGSS